MAAGPISRYRANFDVQGGDGVEEVGSATTTERRYSKWMCNRINGSGVGFWQREEWGIGRKNSNTTRKENFEQLEGK